MRTTLDTFFAFLAAADAVSVDDGALLTNWDTDPCNGEPDNQVAYFSWTDGEGNFSSILTEEGISNGSFDAEGKFVCEDAAGELTVVRFFKVTRITQA